ncbi:hypothetical protein BCR44DRAFT_378506 [Catenaria anguillulae PL171]|uniref:SPIN90/Ldb17 leucine-rich domain-containing protein n=1 Tax=Catenaria anguillulae PL171 TaxID=765915 RepID=A0A1Y2HR42_9FUNG|nr:hypothetical protein BCR44DRAFT_378506 [Catenaria anguillulae PL171]
MIADVVLRSARWHRLPVDAEAVTMEMPLLVLAFATARMARLSDPACYVDDATTLQLLTALHSSRTLRHLEPLHDALAQLLLAINDQSLAWPIPASDTDVLAGPPLPMNTPLLRAICHSPHVPNSSPTSPASTPPPATSSPPSLLSSPCAHSFTETLVFLLNRAAHASDQLLVLKPVYVILAVRPDLFYTNDVRVLLQVVVRVLRDDECTFAVRNALLRVLEVGVPSVQSVGLVDEVRTVVWAVGEWVRVGKVRDDAGGTTARVVARVLEAGMRSLVV